MEDMLPPDHRDQLRKKLLWLLVAGKGNGCPSAVLSRKRSSLSLGNPHRTEVFKIVIVAANKLFGQELMFSWRRMSSDSKIVLFFRLQFQILDYSINLFYRTNTIDFYHTLFASHTEAGLAQSVERQALNLMVEGSSPSFGESFVGS